MHDLIESLRLCLQSYPTTVTQARPAKKTATVPGISTAIHSPPLPTRYFSSCRSVPPQISPNPPGILSDLGLQNSKQSDKAKADDEMSRLFGPPINRAMRVLDREFFKKTVPLSAARIFDAKNTTIIRRECKEDMLRVPRVDPMRLDPDQERYPNCKVLFMRPEVKHDSERHSVMSCVLDTERDS
jgi:hypothetical protein